MSDLPFDFTDPEIAAHLRARALAFIDAVFDLAEEDLLGGDGPTRTAAYKVILPQLLSIAKIADGEATDDARKARDEAQEILEAMRATIPGYSDGLGLDDDG